MTMHIFGLRLENFSLRGGHTVIEAANGEKGVAVVESQAVDIVITDVKMPGYGWV